ncbi:replication protein H [halophilic archaeon]|nr:replication protein H [halophilic archaeon]
MYSVVGCNECNNLWIVDGRPETTQCSRCGKRHRFGKLKTFVETDDEDHAREVRSSMLANRQGHGEAFAELESFAEMESQVEDAGVDDAEFLERSGVDVDEVETAAERDRRSGSTSKREIVREALETLDRPTADEVVAYASDRGISGEYTERALEKMVRGGEVSESRGRYRPL